jgi:hypothetical protein
LHSVGSIFVPLTLLSQLHGLGLHSRHIVISTVISTGAILQATMFISVASMKMVISRLVILLTVFVGTIFSIALIATLRLSILTFIGK